MKQSHRAFTLIEVLVVVTIMGILASIGAVSYTAFTRNARDARRKADIEQLRGALELFRSSNDGVYPTPGAIGGVSCSAISIIDENANTYMSKVPTDPKCPTYGYYYITPNNSDYIIGAYLEGETSTCLFGLLNCGDQSCNYCVGPYGQR